MDSRCFLVFLLTSLHLFPLFSRASLHFPRFSSHQTIHGSVLPIQGVTFDPTRVTQLSWRPRAFIYHGFLSHAECDHLILLAKDKLEKSMVADNESGRSIESKVRTSSGMFLQKAQFRKDGLYLTKAVPTKGLSNFLGREADSISHFLSLKDEIVAGIESRIAAWTFLPKENGESIQILHYENGQKYEPHYDYFHDKTNIEHGGHRIATVLMYLSDVERGGETVFPESELGMSQLQDESWSDCAKNGLAVKPKKGDALLLFSLHPDATTDTSSLHGSCPVLEGEKWSATKWIHVRSFDKPKRPSERGLCTDENDNCPKWAKAGECEKNALYMVGSEGSYGYCRKSCKVCSS